MKGEEIFLAKLDQVCGLDSALTNCKPVQNKKKHNYNRVILDKIMEVTNNGTKTDEAGDKGDDDDAPEKTKLMSDRPDSNV